MNEQDRLFHINDGTDEYPQWVDPAQKSLTEELFFSPGKLRRTLDNHLSILNQNIAQLLDSSRVFRLHSSEGSGYYLTDKAISGVPWLDGDLSSLLTVKNELDEETIIAAVSMMHGTQLPYFLRDALRGRDIYLPDDGNMITIVQLQGQAKRSEYVNKGTGQIFVRNCPEAAVLQHIPWVDFFIDDVVKPWATKIGADNLGIVSSDIIAQKHLDIPADRLQRRYDYTAKRHGFTMNPGGVHLLSLR